MALILLDFAGNPAWEDASAYYAPDLATGLLLSYTAASIVGTVGADADTWPSALAGGSPLTAVSAGQRPVVAADRLTFVGTDRMTIAGVALPTAFTLAVKADFVTGAGWPVQLQSTSGSATRIGMYDIAGSTTYGYYHTGGGTPGSNVANPSISAGAFAGPLWLIFRGTFGALCDYRRGASVTARVACPARTTSETLTLSVGGRIPTPEGAKPGGYQAVHLWNRELHDRDVAALLLT